MARITWQLILVAFVFLQLYLQAESLERIVNGKFAKPKQFPYQVYLRIKRLSDAYMCGGAIISDRLILTAAHCVDDIIDVDIYFGAVNIMNINEVGQQRMTVSAERIRIHEYYDDKFFFNDIALIKLPSNLIFNEYVQPAKLPVPSIDYSHAAVLVPGWGSTKKMGEAATPSMQLMYFESRILSPEECRKFQSFVANSWLCTMSYESTQCSGDSGGAVVVPNPDGSVTLVGLNSFAFSDNQSNCLTGQSNFGTRVSFYLEWIKWADSLLN